MAPLSTIPVVTTSPSSTPVHKLHRRCSNGSVTSTTSSLYSLPSIPEKQLRWADDCEEPSTLPLCSFHFILSRCDYTKQELSHSFYSTTDLSRLERAARSEARRGNDNSRGLEGLTSAGMRRLRTLRITALHAVIKEQYDQRMIATVERRHPHESSTYHIRLAYQYATQGNAEAAWSVGIMDAEEAARIAMEPAAERLVFLQCWQQWINDLQRCQEESCWSLPTLFKAKDALQTF